MMNNWGILCSGGRVPEGRLRAGEMPGALVRVQGRPASAPLLAQERVHCPEDRQQILRYYIACPDSIRSLVGEREFGKLNVLDDDYLAMQEALIAEHFGPMDGRRIQVPVGGEL